MNDFSDSEFKQSIEDHLNKETELRALLGWLNTIYCPTLPTLTRPKKGSERKVILNLSSPAEASVNYRVTRDLLSG